MSTIIDSTGTMLFAESCYLVPDEAFTEEEWYNIDNFPDSEIARIGKENGVLVLKTEQLLQAIADALWGEGADTPWCPDTIQAIADAIQQERPDLVASRI
jgi:hypothetical protein